jgi:anti-sigma B factor antagonist
MVFSTSIDSGLVTLTIGGELDAVSVPELRPALDKLIDEGHKKIVVDLAGLRLIDSSGVGAIVYLFRRVRQGGGNVSVRGATDQPLAILRLLKLDQILIGNSSHP